MAEVSVFRYYLELVLSAQWNGYGPIPCDYLDLPTGDQVTPFAVFRLWVWGLSSEEPPRSR